MIDAFVALADLVREHESLNARYCFVEYLTAQTPCIDAKDFCIQAFQMHRQ